MAARHFKSSIPDLPEAPHHPSSEFLFPKRTFGKATPVKCAAQQQWFSSWPFLHYDQGQDVVFCHTCVTAVKLNKMKSSNNMSPAFVSTFLIHHFLLQKAPFY